MVVERQEDLGGPHSHDPDDECVADEDLAFFKKKVQDSSFIKAAKRRSLLEDESEDRKSKKRKRTEADLEQGEEDYERLPRKLLSKDSNKKMVLPIKTKLGRIVPQMVDYDPEEDRADTTEDGLNGDVDGTETTPDEPENDEPLPELSGVELYLQRQEKLKLRKEKIASLSSAIVENPEENTKKLRELVSMLNEKDPDVCVTVRKYVMLSLLEVFKDIIPGYFIRMPTEKEQEQKMKKETKSILDHEKALVHCYRDYLEFLDRTAKGPKSEVKQKKKKDKIKPKNHLSIPQKSQQALTELSVKCLCELLVKHPHFNYTNNIIVVIVPYMNNRNSKISDVACDCVRQCFKEDKAGNVTLEITKSIGKMIKARDYRVQPKVLDTFLSLRIKEVSYTDPLSKDEKEKEKKNHNMNEKLSRRERKKKKRQMFLERGLQETKATEDKKLRLKLHTETIQSVFLTFFRILKNATNSVLFPSVLEGLAKFAHLINVDFFQDLFTVFNKLILSQELSYRESLHCVQTAFTILSGQGSVLNIDPVIFYKHLYENLFHVHAGSTSADIPIILSCLDIMISKRKRQVSQQRVLAFIKRLATLSLQQTNSGSLGLLAAVRSFMVTYNYTDILLDNEAQGSGMYLPELDDPEHCNAHNTALWELTTLRHHFDPQVRKLSAHVRRGSPTSGDGQLLPELRKDARELFRTADAQEIFGAQLPQKAKPVKHKFQRKELLQEDLKDEILLTLQKVQDSLDLT